MKNLWMSDILERIRSVANSCSDSNLPTYLIIGGEKIPFVIDDVDLAMKKGGVYVDNMQIRLHMESEAVLFLKAYEAGKENGSAEAWRKAHAEMREMESELRGQISEMRKAQQEFISYAELVEKSGVFVREHLEKIVSKAKSALEEKQ